MRCLRQYWWERRCGGRGASCGGRESDGGGWATAILWSRRGFCTATGCARLWKAIVGLRLRGGRGEAGRRARANGKYHMDFGGNNLRETHDGEGVPGEVNGGMGQARKYRDERL